MEGAFAWVSNLIHSFGMLFPRLLHVQMNLGCVLFKRSQVVVLKPGLHLYWPIWSHPELYPIKRQTLNLRPQLLTTHDGRTITVSATVIYEICDIRKALVETYDLEETVADIAQRGIKQVVLGMEFEAIKDEQESLDEQLNVAVRRDLLTHGVAVREAFLSDVAPCFALRNIQ